MKTKYNLWIGKEYYEKVIEEFLPLHISISFSSYFTPIPHFLSAWVTTCTMYSCYTLYDYLTGCKEVINFSYPAYGTTEGCCNPDRGALVDGHVNPWRWKHRLMEVGSANNYSLGSADLVVLNPECFCTRKSEGSTFNPRYEPWEITRFWIVSPQRLMTQVYLSGLHLNEKHAH